MIRNSILALSAVVLMAAFGQATAIGHVTSDGRWLFTGSTYGHSYEPPRRSDRVDPISVIWQGPSGSYANLKIVANHLEADWRDRYVPGRYPRGARMKTRTEKFCTNSQWVFMRSGSSANTGDAVETGRHMSTNGQCTGNQYHTRMWSSAKHGSYFGSEYANEWVLSPIHHESSVTENPNADGIDVNFHGHQIDLDFDLARSVYAHAMMRSHCIDRTWRVHPESSDGFEYGPEGYGPYSGIITRISFKHRSEGCAGA